VGASLATLKNLQIPSRAQHICTIALCGGIRQPKVSGAVWWHQTTQALCGSNTRKKELCGGIRQPKELGAVW